MGANIKPHDIAVLVLSTQVEDYAIFKRAIAKTWAKRFKLAGARVYFYAGGYPNNEIVGDEIRLTVSDELCGTAKKLKSALKMLLEAHGDIKVIYRTNLSSYIEVSNFFKYVNLRDVNEFSYIGIEGKTNYLREYFYGKRLLHKLLTIFPIGKKISFASGSGFFLGVERAKTLISTDLGNELIDDVMVAQALKISPDKIKEPFRFDFTENGEHRLPSAKYFDLVEKKLLFHYRFKTNDRNNDAKMLELFDDATARYEQCIRTD